MLPLRHIIQEHTVLKELAIAQHDPTGFTTEDSGATAITDCECESDAKYSAGTDGHGNMM